MKNKTIEKWFIALFPAFTVAVTDILSKLFTIKFMAGREVLPVFDFFNLVNVYNKGISFSIFSGGGKETTILLMILSALISLLILFWIKKENSRFTVFCLGFILGGALGNLIDRICNGAVFDFLDFHIGKYHWPAFNVADSAVVVGVFTLLAISLKDIVTDKKD